MAIDLCRLCILAGSKMKMAPPESQATRKAARNFTGLVAPVYDLTLAD